MTLVLVRTSLYKLKTAIAERRIKMSIGYIPKKLKHERRQRRLKKKYKNFSCETCRFKEGCMSTLYFKWELYGEKVNVSCPSWKPPYIKSHLSCSKKVAKKRKRKFFR